jgi:hypothetical protein
MIDLLVIGFKIILKSTCPPLFPSDLFPCVLESVVENFSGKKDKY